MAAKSKTSKSTKSRVSKQAKKSTDKKIFIAFGIFLIVIVAVVGIVWYRSSLAAPASTVGLLNTNADSVTYDRYGKTDGFRARAGGTIYINAGKYQSGVQKWFSTSGCAWVVKRNSKFGATGAVRFNEGEAITIYRTNNCQ